VPEELFLSAGVDENSGRISSLGECAVHPGELFTALTGCSSADSIPNPTKLSATETERKETNRIETTPALWKRVGWDKLESTNPTDLLSSLPNPTRHNDGPSLCAVQSMTVWVTGRKDTNQSKHLSFLFTQ
jgi:hypothetical protein